MRLSPAAVKRLTPARLGLVLRGDRLVAAVTHGPRLEAFSVEAEQPAAALRAELDHRKLAPRTVAIGLARTSVTVKPIELPSIEGDVRDMVKFELERHLPYGAEEASFDWIPLPDEREGAAAGSRQVVIAAVDHRVMEAALRLAEEAQLRPVSITVATHNLPALVTRQRQGHIVWVHRLGDNVELLLLAGSSLLLSRVVANDGNIADEVRRSFGPVRWRSCDVVWISGDAVEETRDALGELGVPVGEPPYRDNVRAQLETLPEDSRSELMLALAVASGGRGRPLELLAPALRPRHLTRSQMITGGLMAAAVLLGIVALMAPGYRASRQLSSVNSQIARLDTEVRAVEKVLDELGRRRRLLAMIQSIESTTVRPLPVLRELTELLPGDAWLTMLSLDTKGVELTGQAQAAASLIPLLENSSRLERVEFSSPVTRGRDREQFRIRATWEGTSAATATPTGAGGAEPATGQPRRALAPGEGGGQR
ncbi:MAG TPA: PilN domain-containing protein [Methylomirabilota bacterium]|nr:PilN domain-containing protein [Methylomirabilota bacterium]